MKEDVKVYVPKGICKNGTIIVLRPKEVFKTESGIVVNQDIEQMQTEKDMFEAQLSQPKFLTVLAADPELPYCSGDKIILSPGSVGVRKKLGEHYVMFTNGYSILYYEKGECKAEGEDEYIEVNPDELYNPADQGEFNINPKLITKPN